MKYLVTASRTDEYEIEVEANTSGEAAETARKVIQGNVFASTPLISYWDNPGELQIDNVYEVPEDEA